ncbi:PREDICTED: uncharacterized protein LOC102008868 isoform X2 [Chinchilla lanigera]|uniref:uncharacterized protein LOC102008868 isoform X2 n=1 Tax=Chinchilla lanigera TaxID=34839 RepID=UPI000697E5D8|nr:PREDICTED: uncharacterized protein LOC102008868 isoform X2 [Chinchilla lanigera]
MEDRSRCCSARRSKAATSQAALAVVLCVACAVVCLVFCLRTPHFAGQPGGDAAELQLNVTERKAEVKERNGEETVCAIPVYRLLPHLGSTLFTAPLRKTETLIRPASGCSRARRRWIRASAPLPRAGTVSTAEGRESRVAEGWRARREGLRLVPSTALGHMSSERESEATCRKRGRGGLGRK